MSVQFVLCTAIAWILLVTIARLAIGWQLPLHPPRLTVGDIQRRIARERASSSTVANPRPTAAAGNRNSDRYAASV